MGRIGIEVVAGDVGRLLPDTRMIRMIILVEAQIILKISEQ